MSKRIPDMRDDKTRVIDILKEELVRARDNRVEIHEELKAFKELVFGDEVKRKVIKEGSNELSYRFAVECGIGDFQQAIKEAVEK